MTHSWDPQRYLVYADERGRPFVELLRRVDADEPATVVDLGCGPGNFTRLLATRWPGAKIRGIDGSNAMITRARADVPDIEFEVDSIATWVPDVPVDVLLANAALQWVPGHLAMLPRLLGGVAPRGWFAFQVPRVFDDPIHTVRRDLAAEPLFAELTRSIVDPSAHDVETYVTTLMDLGCTVDAWETTYHHVLRGEDPVFAWIAGTAARPTLDVLPGDVRAGFEIELKARLRQAYPTRADGTVILPFRRLFVVVRKP